MLPSFDESTSITPYGLMLVVALLTCFALSRRAASRAGFDASHVDLAFPLLVLCAALGAKLAMTVLPGDTSVAGFAASASQRLRLFGLLALGIPALALYCRITRLSFWRLADVFAVPALASIALIRVGCLAAGCCWGDVVGHARLTSSLAASVRDQLQTLPALSGDWLLAIGLRFAQDSFAHRQHVAAGLIEADAAHSLPVHPTQLYELALLVVACVILWRIKNTLALRPGTIFLGALLAYSLCRFAVEFFRADNVPFVSLLTLHQLISLALGGLAVATLVLLRARRRQAPNGQ